MSLRQLEYFLTVADEGHVGRAAERLHMAQPPLSRQIRALEDELGVELFRRTARGMSLSDAGSAFVPYARGVLDAVDAARASVAPPRARS